MPNNMLSLLLDMPKVTGTLVHILQFKNTTEFGGFFRRPNVKHRLNSWTQGLCVMGKHSEYWGIP